VSGQLNAPADLLRSPRYIMDGRLDGPQIRCKRCGKGKNVLSLPGIEPRFPGVGARNLVTIPAD
jgi:hypothetical protein